MDINLSQPEGVFEKDSNFIIIFLIAHMQEAMSEQLCRIDGQREIYRMGSIGAGKFGTVYQGYDKLNNRMVALKYVCNNKQESWRKQIQALEMFDHPNIVKYYCHIPQRIQNSEEIAGVYIVTQFVRGKTLDQYIASAAKVGERGLSESMVLKLFTQLLDGYGEVHNKNYVHRDIKPQNILVDENQNIKIIDFGQSKERKLLKTHGLGTPLYSAPETFSGKVPADFRRDVWSLGLVLYEMIVGRCYFEEWKQCCNEGLFIKHLQNHRIKVKFPKNFSPFWSEITKKMLQKDYNKRINLHQIIFQLKKQQPQFDKKLKPLRLQQPVVNLAASIVSGNTNPLTQSQNEFQFSRTKKYLKFFNNKYKFLVLLNQFLTRFSYPFLSNSHKLMLVYLSLSIYVAAIDHLLKRLQKNRIKITQNEIFDVSTFEEPYQSAMKEHLSVYRDYYEKQSRITKDVLLQKIIPKFSVPEQNSSSTESVGSSTSVRKKSVHPSQIIQKYPEIKKEMQDFKQGINYSKTHYIDRLRQLVFSDEYYQSLQNIRKFFYQQDMVVYYLILIVCHIDQMLQWKNEYLGNQIPKLKEELEHNKRDEEEVEALLIKIQKYNKKP